MKKLLLFLIFFICLISSEAQTTAKDNSGLDSMKLTLTEKDFIAEPDSILLFNGRKIARAEMDSIFKKAWDDSFGKMSEEDKNLFNNTSISIVTEDEKIEGENIVSIGNQIFIAENLTTETVKNGDPISDSVVNDYFVKINQYSEHKTEKQPIKKFVSDVNIFIQKDYTIDEAHLKEVKKVIK